MPVRVFEYIDVGARARKLGCEIPTRLCLLPANFTTARSRADLVYDEYAPLLRQEWRRAGLTETPLEKRTLRFAPPVPEGGNERVRFAFFIGAELMNQNCYAVTVAVSVTAGILEEIFRDRPGRGQAVVDVIVERRQGGGYIWLQYDGDALGPIELELKRAIKNAWESKPPEQRDYSSGSETG